MTTEEHLKKIKAKCEELLASAEKRTPGKWSVFCSPGERPGVESGDTNISVVIIGIEADENDDGGVRGRTKDEAFGNATFISSCAGPAEAGWRATIAAVDALARLSKFCSNGCDVAANDAINAIIAAWPEELL